MALDFAAGCLGGCAGVLVGHPFDTVKVLLQTQDAKRPIYKGTFHCLKSIVVKDSFRGLYRGMSSPLAGVAFVNAIVFGVYGNIQRNTNDPNSLMSHFLAGSSAGLVQSLVCSPMELAKTRIQLQGDCPNSVKHKGPLQCIDYIRRTEGFRGVFRGLRITALRDVPGFASYFVSYELLTRHTNNPSALHTLLAGGLAGTMSWLLSFPMDIIKSRLQADGMSGRPQYTGILDCVRKGYRSEGASFFLRGLSSTLIRAFPMNAACFLVVSWTMKLAEKANLNVEIHQVEPLAVVGSITAPFAHPGHHHKLHHDHHESRRRRSHLIKSLVFCGAFSEAVCSTEIVELANDLYDDHYTYYDFNTSSYNHSAVIDNDDHYLLLSH